MAAAQQNEPENEIVIKGTSVILDVERLDMASEIPRIDVPDLIRSERDGVKRRDMYCDWIERRIEAGERPYISATSTTIEDEEWKVATLLIADRQELAEGKLIPAQRVLSQELRVELATWSGMPLSDKRLFRAGGAHLRGVKVGLRPFPGRDAQTFERRGGTLNIYADYPARFQCSLVEGRRLLDLYGWRLSAHKDEWILYEVGGPLEREIALWLADCATVQGKPELAERARLICPAAFGEETADGSSRRRNK